MYENFKFLLNRTKITVAARSKAWTVFARLDAEFMVWNPTQEMDVCLCVYSLFVLSCLKVAALRRAYHSSKNSYHRCKKWKRNWRKGHGPCKSVRARGKKKKEKTFNRTKHLLNLLPESTLVRLTRKSIRINVRILTLRTLRCTRHAVWIRV
jgi:hypothetical protein